MVEFLVFIQTFLFCNLSCMATSIVLERKLSSEKIKGAVGSNYGKLQYDFKNFRNVFKRKITNNEKFC